MAHDPAMRFDDDLETGDPSAHRDARAWILSQQPRRLETRRRLDARHPAEGGPRMPRERTGSRWILIAAALCTAPWAYADEPEARRTPPARHDPPPRKVIVGTTMTRWYGDYPASAGGSSRCAG
jgi:hypothetical protein